MRRILAEFASRHGFFHARDTMFLAPSVLRWIRRGSGESPPQPLKRFVILHYLDTYGCREFVETGTHIGDTLAFVSRRRNIDCTSIELDEGFHRRATRRFKHSSRVRLLHGNSGLLMPEVVGNLKGPALFWLDGHYSGPSTACGGKQTPVLEELVAIYRHASFPCVILIDDARLFDGTNDYPHLDELLVAARSVGGFRAEVSADIIRLTPHGEAHEGNRRPR